MKQTFKTIIIKVFIFTLIAGGFVIILPAQNAFHDALVLSKNDEILGLVRFVKDNHPDYKKIINPKDYSEVYKVNKFLSDLWNYQQVEEISFDKLKNEIKVLIPRKAELEKYKIKIDKAEEITSAAQNTEKQNAKSIANNELKSSFTHLPLQSPASVTEKAGISNFTSSTFQSNLIDAVGTIIAERFKEGLTVMYINKFRKKLNEFDGTIFIKALLPETFKLVNKGNPFDFNSLGKELKKAISADLNNLPGNLLTFLKDKDNEIGKKLKGLKKDEKKNEALIDILTKLQNLKGKPLFQYLMLAVDISEKLVEGSHPIDLLNYLDLKIQNLSSERYAAANTGGTGSSKIIPIETKIYRTIHLINIFQHNLRALNESTGDSGLAGTWIGYKELKELVSPENGNKNGIKYFLALIYSRNISFFTGYCFETEKNPTEKKVVKGFIEKEVANLTSLIYDKIIPIYQIVARIDGFSKKENMTTEDYLNYMQTALDLVEGIFDKFGDENIKDKTENVIAFSQICLNTFMSIYQKDYSRVISNVVAIIERLEAAKVGAKQESKDEMGDLLIDDIHENVFRGRELTTSQKKQIKSIKFLSFLKFLAKYGEFMETLASAKNAEEMKGLISTVILPSGSFIKKRKTPFSLTISAHPGVYAGLEYLERKMEDGAFVYGFTAPIGLEICLGAKNQDKRDKLSVGIFLSVIDLGAVVSHRVSSEYTGFPKEITFKQVLSPGISLNLGLMNSPITFGFGAQWTPQLRKIIENDIVLDEKKKAWRIFTRISWDIPLIPITRLK